MMMMIIIIILILITHNLLCNAIKQSRVVAQDLMTSLQGASSPGVPPAALQDTPVRSTEVCIAQSIADWVDRTVDIAQPITCNISITQFQSISNNIDRQTDERQTDNFVIK